MSRRTRAGGARSCARPAPQLPLPAPPPRYGAPRTLCPAPALVAQQSRQRQAARRQPPLGGDMAQLMERVVAAAAQLGAGHEVAAHGGLGEECERELEREEEEEAEEERQVPRSSAAEEADWEFTAALGVPSLADLQRAAGLPLLRLRELAAQLVPPALGALPWSPWVWAMPNFAAAVALPAGQVANEYLRPVGELLLLPAAAEEGGAAGSGRGDAMLAALLLSEREGSGLLEAMWSSIATASSSEGGSSSSETPAASRQPPLLVSLCFACAAQPLRNGGAAMPLRLAASAVGGGRWADDGPLTSRLRAGDLRPQLVSLQLWDGETTYADPAALGQLGWEAQRALPTLSRLRRLVAGQGAAVEALVSMRGKGVLFSHSQLERACDAEGGGGGMPTSP